MKPRYREAGVAGQIRNAIRFLADLFSAYRRMPNMVQLADGSTWLKIADNEEGLQLAQVYLPEGESDEEDHQLRSKFAMELLDPDVRAVMVFLLKRMDDGKPQMDFRAQITTTQVKAFTESFSIVLEGMGAFKR